MATTAVLCGNMEWTWMTGVEDTEEAHPLKERKVYSMRPINRVLHGFIHLGNEITIRSICSALFGTLTLANIGQLCGVMILP